jgi:hypothetical protein
MWAELYSRFCTHVNYELTWFQGFLASLLNCLQQSPTGKKHNHPCHREERFLRRGDLQLRRDFTNLRRNDKAHHMLKIATPLRGFAMTCKRGFDRLTHRAAGQLAAIPLLACRSRCGRLESFNSCCDTRNDLKRGQHIELWLP